MYQQFKNSSKPAAAPAAPAAPASSDKCPHPEAGVRCYMRKDGAYEYFQYDYTFVLRCSQCEKIFVNGCTDWGGLRLDLMRGDKDWCSERSISNKEYHFQGWLEQYKISHTQVDVLPKS